MPRYSYVAKNEAGSTVKGIETAASRELLADRLAGRGLYLVHVRSGSFSGIHFEFITRSDLVLFTSQLIPVVATGVPLLAGLEDLAEMVSAGIFAPEGKTRRRIYRPASLEALSGKATPKEQLPLELV